MRATYIFFLALILAGCQATYCDCGPCPPAIALDIVVPGGAVPEISGTPALTCETAASMTYCFTNDAEPGEYTYTVSAAGREPESVTLTVEPGTTGGCCSCRVTGDSARVQFEILDAAVPGDAGDDAGTSSDAGSSADAGLTCNPDLVDFPMGGDLSVGTLCDDVFVCIATSRVDELTAAAPSFDCTIGPGDPGCGGGTTRCSYQSASGGPSVLDQAEVSEICAVTVLSPPPDSILCRVYL